MRRSRIIILSLIVAATGVIAALTAAPAQLRQRLGDEGYKQLWQLSVASIIGGLVSGAFAELKREQDSIEARRKYLRDFHAAGLAAYNRAKKIRRLLRAKVAGSGGTHIHQADYEANMLELQDVQLHFESMKRQVKLSTSVFAAAPQLKDYLKTLEEYLRSILSEFEKPPISVSGNTAVFQLPKFQALIEDDGSSTFPSEFGDTYDKVEAELLKLLSA